MIERLGIVVYWVGVLVSFAMLLFAGFAAYAADNNGLVLFAVLTVPAALVWFAGRGVRYILTGIF